MMTDLSAAAGRAAKRSSEMPMDDLALVEALRAGDPQGPRLLIERYQGIVFGLCYRMMNHQQDAEDVVQETFIRAYRSLAQFRGGYDTAEQRSIHMPSCGPTAARPSRPIPRVNGLAARATWVASTLPFGPVSSWNFANSSCKSSTRLSGA